MSGFVGDVTFQYRAFDNVDYSDPVTVTIHVTDAAPTAIDHVFSIHQGQTLDVSPAAGLLQGASDADPTDSLTAVLLSYPATYASFSISSDGSFSYTQAAGFVGDVTFQACVSDGALTSDPITVTIHVTHPAPAAIDHVYSTH